MSNPIILLADDDPDDRLFTREALEEAEFAHYLVCVEDGEELLDYLLHRGKYQDRRSSPQPAIILLDLNMPRKDGREALYEIKSDSVLRRIPVVVLTTSRAEEDIFHTYNLGVNSFIVKPVTYKRLVEALRILGKFWFETAQLPPS